MSRSRSSILMACSSTPGLPGIHSLGFGFLFHLLGEVRLLLPWAIDCQVPGSYKAWRMTHLEAIMNGLGLWLFAATLPILEFSATANRRIAIGTVIAAWTFVIASIFDCIACRRCAWVLFWVSGWERLPLSLMALPPPYIVNGAVKSHG